MKTITIIATAMLLLVCCETNAINAVDGMTATYDDNALDPNETDWNFSSQYDGPVVPIYFAVKISMPSFELIIMPKDVEDMSKDERHAFGAMIGVLQTINNISDEFLWTVLTEGLPQRLLEKVVVKGE